VERAVSAPVGTKVPNKFGAVCPVCKKYVANRAGFAVLEPGGWTTYCTDHTPGDNPPAATVPPARPAS
jgi:hypothetical protein